MTYCMLVAAASVGDYKPEEHPEGYTHDFIKFFYPSVEAAVSFHTYLTECTYQLIHQTSLHVAPPP